MKLGMLFWMVFFLTAPAMAAPPKGLDCVLETTGPLQRQAVLNMGEGKTALNADEKLLLDNAVVGVEDCKQRLGWTELDLTNAFMYLTGVASLERANTALIAKGMSAQDIAVLDSFGDDLFEAILARKTESELDAIGAKYGFKSDEDIKKAGGELYLGARLVLRAGEHGFKNSWTEQQMDNFFK